MGDLLLVRHGETEWSRSGRHTSWTDVPLTAAGEDQARAVAPLLAGYRVVTTFTSPLLRARRTAELAGLGGALVDADMREWDYGAYEGITTAEIQRTRPDWFLFSDGVAAGEAEHPGESPAQVGARADRVLATADAALAAADGDGTGAGAEPGGDRAGVSPDDREPCVVLVAHGHFLRVLTARRLGLPPAAGALFQLATGTVSRLGTEHGRPVLADWNVRPRP